MVSRSVLRSCVPKSCCQSTAMLQRMLLILVLTSTTFLPCSCDEGFTGEDGFSYEGTLDEGWSNGRMIRFTRDLDNLNGSSPEDVFSTTSMSGNNTANVTEVTEVAEKPTTSGALPDTTSDSTSTLKVTDLSVTTTSATSPNSTAQNNTADLMTTVALPNVTTAASGSGESSSSSAFTSTTVPHTTTEILDDRTYYTISYSKTPEEGKSYWRDIDGLSYTHKGLEGRLRALQIQIPFNFTYYGHDVDKITIAIGGFLYMSPFLHRYLSATQYVAPLMADFNSSISEGIVYYALLDDALVIEWRNVHLHSQQDVGPFSFQAQLFREDGKIVFAYQNIPIPVSNISTELHYVKVGLADAYYYDFGFLRTIHEYHDIAIQLDKVVSHSAIIFTHLPTCNMQEGCDSCHNVQLPEFECFWCEEVKRCSNTVDRGRQAWFANFCPFHDGDGTPTKDTCKGTSKGTMKDATTVPGQPGTQKVVGGTDESGQSHAGRTVGVIIAVMLIIVVVAALALYIYSYSHPSSIPGQFLIKYRPSELCSKWRHRGNQEETYGVGTQVLTNEAYEGYPLA